MSDKNIFRQRQEGGQILLRSHKKEKVAYFAKSPTTL